jgi:RNA polymerase sigma-70 factor (ECF subfamily)
VAEHAAYLEDLMLVDRCLDGEQAAARELFQRQRSRIQASLYRILGNNRDMDDLLQETFVQVFRSLGSFRGEARLSTWIDRIAVRVAYRYLAARRSAALTVELGDEPAGDPMGRPDRRAMAREGVRRFYAALAQQSPNARIAYTLHEIEGRSVAEVADITGASVTTTKLRIWRTRRTLFKLAAQDPVLCEFLRDDDRPKEQQ